MRRLLLSIGCLVIGALSAINLLAQEHATVICDEETFQMKSPASGTLKVKRTVNVRNDRGLPEATFAVFTNQSETLADFSGTLTSHDGTSRKIKKKDLQTIAVGTGLAEDAYMMVYQPSARCPFTVTYEYTVQYHKGFAVFPSYFPITTEKTRLEHGSYTLSIPPGTKINYLVNGFGSPKTGAGTYTWTIERYEGFSEESYMPDIRSVIPSIQAAPQEFMYDGFPGRQGNWSELGQWQYGLLQGTDDLPAERAAEMKALTSSCKSDLEKVRVIYDYLCRKTRYVSIQFGIGGFRPFPCSVVDKTGFGDCKALSNYFMCLLKSVGIPSFYTVLDTRRSRFAPEYSSLGQGDHVMVSVPLKEIRDTLLIECTRRLPLGYRPSHVAGHDILVIKPGGGQLLRAPAYPDSLRLSETLADVRLKADGSAAIDMVDRYCLDKTEPWLEFRDWDQLDKVRRLSSGLGIQPRGLTITDVEDNFESCDGRKGWYPWIRIHYSLECNTFGKASGNRLIVPVNLFAKKMFIQRTARTQPIQNQNGSLIHDRLIYRLPEGYQIESLPDPVSLDTPWGSFRSEIATEQDNIVVNLLLHIKAFREDRSQYDSFRSFARSFNSANDASIVLVRKNSTP